MNFWAGIAIGGGVIFIAFVIFIVVVIARFVRDFMRR